MKQSCGRKLNRSVGVNGFLYNSVVTSVFCLKANFEKNKAFTARHVLVNVKWEDFIESHGGEVLV